MAATNSLPGNNIVGDTESDKLDVYATSEFKSPATFTQPVTFGGAVSFQPNSIQGVVQEAGEVLAAGQTEIDFSIPSWAKKVSIDFSEFSTSGVDYITLLLGTAVTFLNTGYTSVHVGIGDAINPNVTQDTTLFRLSNMLTAASYVSGSVVLDRITAKKWAINAQLGHIGTLRYRATSGGIVSVDDITRLKITSIGGIVTFDAGSINVLYE